MRKLFTLALILGITFIGLLQSEQGVDAVEGANSSTPPECGGTVPGEWIVIDDALSVERAGIDPFFLPGGPGAEDDLVVAAGGYDTNNHNAHLGSVDLYDVSENSWDVGPALPEDRGQYESVVLDEYRAILIGGTSGISGSDSLYASTVVYDLRTNSWARGPELQDPLVGTQVSDRRSGMRTEKLASGDVIVTGGVNPSSNPTGTTNTYIIRVDSSLDPADWDVEKVASMGTRRQNHATAVFFDGSGNEKILAAGGFEQVWVILNTAEVYDVATDTWTPVGNMSDPRYWGEMAVGGDGNPVVFGGELNSGTSLASTDVFDAGSGNWIPESSPGSRDMVQSVRWHDSISLESGEILSVSGHASGIDVNDVQIYNPTSLTWSAWPDLHFPRRLISSGGTVALPGGRVLVAGGVGADHSPFPGPSTELFIPCAEPNEPPTVTVDVDSVVVDEGSLAINSGTFSDPDADDEVTISASSGTITQTSGNSGTWSWSLATVDGPDDSDTVTITATDAAGEVGVPVTFDLTVNNVAPVALTFGCPSDPVAVGSAVVCTGTFGDVVADSHTAELHWSDGVVTGVTIVENSISGSRTFASPDVLWVDLVVTDDDGGSSDPLRHQFVVVYDPSAGFATGGGWFVPGSPGNSDLDDLMPNLDGTSKANFGFVVKYQNGQSTAPSGNLEFQYKVGGINLTSVDYEWLVLTNNNWAKFNGTATIKGLEGEFPFRVDARDGITQPDRFVIRIWAPGGDPDFDGLLYKASGDLGGGKIKIHN
ncbi:MAG: hypothetical protein HOF43_05730 [Chloroflexi bacterium]|jgi:hypothetical protein|nr:hypothetical protein [Chloroflexota bacterium]MBT6681844.1 hypothetical protein [Chloroflexota bacterium]